MSNIHDTADQELDGKIEQSARALLNIYAPHAELSYDWEDDAWDVDGMLSIRYDVPSSSANQPYNLCQQLEKIAPKLAEKGIILKFEELSPPDERRALDQPYGDCEVTFTMPESPESVMALNSLTRSLTRERAQQIILAATRQAHDLLETSSPDATLGDLNRTIADMLGKAQGEVIGHSARQSNR